DAAPEKGGIGIETDEDERGPRRDHLLLAIVAVTKPDGFELSLAGKLDHLGVAVDDEARVVVHLVLEEARRGQLRVALHDADAGGEFRQEQAFLERRVTATNDQKLVGAAVERAVTGCAEMNAGADQIVLAGNAEAAIRGPCGDQCRVGLDLLTAGETQADVTRLRPFGGDVLDADRAQELDLVATGLGDEALGEGDAATDDREVVAPALGLEREPELARQLLVGRLDEHVGPVKDDRRNRAASLLQLLDVLQGGGIVVDVHPLVGDALLRQESFRALAIGAPGSAVDGDPGHQPRRERSVPTPARVPRKRSTILPFASMMITVGGERTLYSEAIRSLASLTLA